MTDTRQIDKRSAWNASGKILGVFALDEFIMLAVHDGDRHLDLRQILCRLIRLRSLHKPDGFDKLVKLLGRCR